MISPTLQESIAGIREDRTHGAGWLSLQALHILITAAVHSRAATCEAFTHELFDIARALIAARPTMAHRDDDDRVAACGTSWTPAATT